MNKYVICNGAWRMYKDWSKLRAIHLNGQEYDVGQEWEWYREGLIFADEFYNKTGIEVEEMWENWNKREEVKS